MAAPLVAPVMPAAWGEKKVKGLRGRKTFAVIAPVGWTGW